MRTFLALSAFCPLFALAQVTVQEYPVPPGHRVHDVWADAAPGGPVWISAQGSGHLGILDPKSGKVEFVPLGSGSSPHAASTPRSARKTAGRRILSMIRLH